MEGRRAYKTRKKPEPKEEYIRYVRYLGNPNVRNISIPSPLADELGINRGDKLRIRKNGSCIVINKMEEGD